MDNLMQGSIFDWMLSEKKDIDIDKTHEILIKSVMPLTVLCQC